jgi:copper(I)-binding protein
MLKRRDFLLTGGTLLTGTALGLFASRGPASAHEYDVGNLKVEHPWLRAPVDGDNKAQFYAILHNSGATPDKLIAVKSEKFGRAEVHGDAKKLDLVTPIVVPPKSTLTLAPGGAYVALLDIKKHLEVGWGLEMTLVFEKAGEVEIDAAIDAPDAAHAHDAEAMERWQKAHGQDSAGPKEGAAHQDHEHHEHHMDKK